MKNCQTSRSARNHEADCILIRREKRAQHSCSNSHSEKSKIKIAALTPIMGCRCTTRSYGSLTVLLDCTAGDNSFPLSPGGLSNARVVGNWASAKLQAAPQTPEAAAVWPLLCIARPQSNWSVIDTGAPLFDPWRRPKRKANRAFPLSACRAECLDSDSGAGSQHTWHDRSHAALDARAVVQGTMRKYRQAGAEFNRHGR